MPNFDQSFTLLADIKLNADVLDTGLINIVIFVAFLIYALKGPLEEVLEERRKRIDKEILNSKLRLKEAEKRLRDAQRQYQQAQIAKKELEKRFLDIRKASLNQSLNLAQKDFEGIFKKAFEYYSIKSDEVVEEITFELKSRVYDELVMIVKKYFKSTKFRRKYMNKTFNRLKTEFNKGDFE